MIRLVLNLQITEDLNIQKNEDLMMSLRFIKKEGMAVTELSRYLLGETEGARLKTIEELSQQFSLSVGIIQQALKMLEEHNLIKLERRGRNGTIITYMDIEKLIARADIKNIVCAMPLPYTRLYEGLASGLKAQFTQVPLYFAHMRGADVRIECLINGVYDIAVVSKLAAEHYLAQQDVEILFALGKRTYVDGHQLICRKEMSQRDSPFSQIKRIGVDPRSPDQRILTESYFANMSVELVNIPYHKGMTLIEKGAIDGMIWNKTKETESSLLCKMPLNDKPVCQKATEAVILTRKENIYIKQLISRIVNVKQLLQHQCDVVNGIIDPSY